MNSYPLLTWGDLVVLRQYLAQYNANFQAIDLHLANALRRIQDLEAEVARLKKRRRKK